MCNKLGLREVTIIGSVMASAFFVISSFSANIDMMLVTYGIMGGPLSHTFVFQLEHRMFISVSCRRQCQS